MYNKLKDQISFKSKIASLNFTRMLINRIYYTFIINIVIYTFSNKSKLDLK